MSRADAVRVLAPAKVNPWLEVRGRREDGFHDLETWMVAVELFDELEARRTPAGGVTLEVAGPAAEGVPGGRENLALRATEVALDLARKAGAAEAGGGLALRLFKRIPPGAGLGGGSSDAAAAFAAVEALCGPLGPEEQVRAALAALGSDCVFFRSACHSGSGWCEGRGERVRPLPAPHPAWHVMLLAPAIAVPTASVYRALRIPLSVRPRPHSLAFEEWFGSVQALRSSSFNRLEEAALRAEPALRRWRDMLDEEGLGHVRLSGSGSTFFGVYAHRGQAQAALDRAVEECRRRGLALRGSWVVRSAGRGAGP